MWGLDIVCSHGVVPTPLVRRIQSGREKKCLAPPTLGAPTGLKQSAFGGGGGLGMDGGAHFFGHARGGDERKNEQNTNALFSYFEKYGREKGFFFILPTSLSLILSV